VTAHSAYGTAGYRRRDVTISHDDTRPPLASTAARIAAITFASGADNISVTPLFRTLHWAGSLLTTGLFLALIGLWCAVSAVLGTHRATVAALGRVSHSLVPVMFIAVGVLILLTSGTAMAVADLL
jgi:cadmium resistance protein CadD (predicted permease)